jgi:GNAT superfamily N-acetyltransferase
MTPGRRRSAAEPPGDFTFAPLTAARWKDFERLFGPRGACAGCWCMWWRLTAKEFERRKGTSNKRAMKALVRRGDVPGILAYAGEEAVGWCAAAPREAYARLRRSRILRPVDDADVWSVVCFFVAKDWRRRGVTTALLRAATKYVRSRGGKIVEGYPVEPAKGKVPDAFAYPGLAGAFKAAGFVEVARRSPTRPIMRHVISSA